ncbi:unannotated protein [freshwater metagenome]
MKAAAEATIEAAIAQATKDPEPTVKDMFSNIFTSQKVG